MSSLQEEVDRAALTMARTLGAGRLLQSDTSQGVQLTLVRQEGGQAHSFQGQGASLSLSLEEEEEGEEEDRLIVFKSYRDLGCILNRQESCSSPPRLGEGRRVNSRVVGADMYLGRGARKVSGGQRCRVEIARIEESSDCDCGT